MLTKLRFLKERWRILSGVQKVSIIFLGVTLIALPLSVVMSFDPIKLFSRASYPVSPPYTPPPPNYLLTVGVYSPNQYKIEDQFIIWVSETSPYRSDYVLNVPQGIVVLDTSNNNCISGNGCVIKGSFSSSSNTQIKTYMGYAMRGGNYQFDMAFTVYNPDNTVTKGNSVGYLTMNPLSPTPRYTSYPTASSTSYPTPRYTTYPTASGSATPMVTSTPYSTFVPTPASTMVPGNKLPSITTSLLPIAIKGRPYQVTFTGKDVDGDKTYFTVEGMPGREAYPRACTTNINKSGVATTKCTFYYIMDKSGRFKVTVKATDQKHGLDFALRNYSLLVVSRVFPSR